MKRTARVTAKQIETVQLLARGHTSKEIARLCGVSASAIDQRIDGAVRRAGVADRRALIRWYIDTSVQLPGEAAQVGLPQPGLSSSETDRSKTETGIVGADRSITTPPFLLVSTPETWLGWYKLRHLLEGAFFVVMIALGGEVLIHKLT